MKDLTDTLKMIEVLKEMVNIVLPVAEDDPLNNVSSAAYRLARDVLRRNIMRVQSIVILSGYEKMGDSALEITRNMIEDVISMNYILSDDNPEKLTEVFYEFRWVQAKQDHIYYSKLGHPSWAGNLSNTKRINKEYDRVVKTYASFTKRDGSIAVSWSRDGIDGMAKKLIKRKIYTKKDMNNILRTYQNGSRKTHFNPKDLINYGNQNTWDSATVEATRTSLLATSACIYGLTLRYMDTIKHYDASLSNDEILTSLKSKYQYMQSLDV